MLSKLTAALFIATGLSTLVAEESKRPNIVVILCDDLGYGDLECYGHPHIKTPHLNRMADEGIRFTDFYSAAPVCSPSRVGLLTGRSPNRAGIYDFIPGGRNIYMQASEVTFPQLLQKAGYATCMSGKWHCNGKFNSASQPQPDAAGFDHWFGTQNNASPSHENPNNFVRNGEKVGELEGYSCQLVADEALDWLTQQQESEPEQPFFMYVAFHEPHEPVASPKNLVDQYKDASKNEDEAQYFANVANIDAAVGKVLAALKDKGLDENTLVIFTSDNGPETLNRYSRAKRSFGVADPLRGMKLWTTEAGFRVAGIMRWPSKIEAGQTVKHPVSSLDFFPTFCDLAGVEPPADLLLDGTNFLPALGNQALEREKPLLWVFYNALNERRVAMRDGEWKIMAKMNLPKYITVDTKNEDKVKAATLTDFQLFHVSEDHDESEDLSKSHPEKLAELKELLEVQYRELVNGSHIWEAKK
ncbi:MAG: sulfatase family protein [Luteolibacter sp.]